MTERRWWTAAVVLLVAATASFTVAGSGYLQSAGPPQPPSSAAVLVAAPRSTAHSVPRSTPVDLRIPAINVAVSLSTLDLNPDDTVEVPTDYQQPGWYRPGPAPGQLGSAVILGHVDSYQGPGVFFRLGALRPGDRISVRLADGTVTHFVVDKVASYPKTRFPAHQVYGPHGYSALQLVTCGGTFDRATGHYLSNIVAFSQLIGTTRQNRLRRSGGFTNPSPIRRRSAVAAGAGPAHPFTVSRTGTHLPAQVRPDTACTDVLCQKSDRCKCERGTTLHEPSVFAGGQVGRMSALTVERHLPRSPGFGSDSSKAARVSSRWSCWDAAQNCVPGLLVQRALRSHRLVEGPSR
jgi:hypothetical protein